MMPFMLFFSDVQQFARRLPFFSSFFFSYDKMALSERHSLLSFVIWIERAMAVLQVDNVSPRIAFPQTVHV